MSRVDLTAFMSKEAQKAKREMSTKLLARKGVRGRFLKQKKRSNKRPLGFGRSRTGIPGRLRRGLITARRDSFKISFTSKVGWFHRGFSPQNRPPRPVAGLSKAQERKIDAAATAEAARQVTEILKRS